MKCSRRSTTWRGSPLTGLAVFLWLMARPALAQEGGDEWAVRAAIRDAVLARIGVNGDIRIEGLALRVRDGVGSDGRLVATPEPGARLARAIRFSLSLQQEGIRPKTVLGYATATVFLSAACVRASREIPPGTVLSTADVVETDGDAGDGPLQKLPAIAELLGSRTRRALRAGELVLASSVSVPRAVQSGDPVTLRSRAEGVEVEARGIAVQSGGAGDVIRVVNAGSRRALTARVVGPGEVEVVR